MVRTTHGGGRADDATGSKRPRRRSRVVVGIIAAAALGCGLAFLVASPERVARMARHLRQTNVTVRVGTATMTYDGDSHPVPGLVDANDDGEVCVVGSDGQSYVVTGLATEGDVMVPSDSGVVRATGEAVVTDEWGNDVTDEVALTVEPGSVEVLPRDLWLTSADVSEKFDASDHAGGDMKVEQGFVAGDGATYEFTGTQVAPGESENTFDVKWDKGTDPSCYVVHKEEGLIEVKPLGKKDERIPVTVSGKSQTITFDGREHVFEAIEDGRAEVAVDGVTYVIDGLESEPVRATAAGTYEAKVAVGKGTKVTLLDGGDDLTDQFDITCESGTLTIERGDLWVATFFGGEDDWTDSLFVSDDCETFRKIGEVPTERRDPSIMWHEGRFWVITSLNECDGNLWLWTSSSSDLDTWSEPQRHGPFPLDPLPDAGGASCDVVAPEWFRDDDGSVHIIFSCGWWGANHGARWDDHMQAYVADVDVLSFDGTHDVLRIDNGCHRMSLNMDGDDRIDGYAVRAGGSVWVTIKRHGLTAEVWRNDNLVADGWELVRGKALYGFEGFCVTGLGNGLCMFADGVPYVEPYGTRRWVADALDGAWEERPLHFVDEAGRDMGAMRHGTVLGLSRDDERELPAWEIVAAKIDG